MIRVDLPPNPFDPNEEIVPVPLARVFGAVDDVNREYKFGRRPARDAFNASCDRAIAALAALKLEPTR